MKLKITVHGVAYEVEVEVLDPGEDLGPVAPLPAVRSAPAASAASAGAARGPAPLPTPGPAAGTAPPPDGKSVVSPIAGTVLEITCAPGDRVDERKVLLIIEAMKMKTSIAAPMGGTVKKVHVAAGDTVRENQLLVEFE